MNCIRHMFCMCFYVVRDDENVLKQLTARGLLISIVIGMIICRQKSEGETRVDFSAQ